MSDGGRLVGWHFAAKTLRDGSPLPREGSVLKHKGPVVPCKSGYHASVRAIDALSYAPGTMVARVELRGTVVPHGKPVDKYAASERKTLTRYVDATRVLHEFACWCATRALDREEAVGRKVDARSRAAIATKLAWLDGKTTDAEQSAAWAAATALAWAAAKAAAWGKQNAELERRLLALVGATALASAATEGGE